MSTVAALVVPLDLPKAVDQLKRDEAFRALPYHDSRGILTIMYGVNIQSGGFTEDEGALVLQHRAWNVYLELLKALPWVKYIDAARQGVLLNMAYNLGVVGELGFHVTLADVQAGKYSAAAAAMRKSLWYSQVGARAERLAIQMETGEWQ